MMELFWAFLKIGAFAFGGDVYKRQGISKYEMIRRCPNGAIRRNKAPASYTEFIGV